MVISFREKQLSFRPVYTLIMLVGIGICLWAAQWQYFKAQAYQQPVIPSIQLTGEFFNETTRFLDNQTLNGDVGYGVLTVFKSGKQFYLINRGFYEYQDRYSMPDISPVNGVVTLRGKLTTPAQPLVLDTTVSDPIKKRIQSINVKTLSNELGILISHYIVQSEGKGLLTPLPVRDPYLSEHKHLGYALQWLLLAIAGFVILLFASINKKNKKEV
ncbi:SURF1 family protein [Bermanella marisrubri]|uniref:SURF1-like protein n=1 Tax=Bermanella marisrubri TaxID=207949 RepID=Q1N2M8_9GAMM|nr:SURF1 family protein [Bermanella marisrubri]EAT12379.1 Putative transmembrane cytochrome oxidase complex biogenesis factor [Oceanobacter sp. RED65] [Bermanella marisrubri]QIZ85462.1 SURF1 family protein [Bermanella marisrubri]